MMVVATTIAVVKFKIRLVVVKAKEWSLMCHVWKYTMNKSCNCEVGRDPEVGNELVSLVQASVVNVVHARLKKNRR